MRDTGAGFLREDGRLEHATKRMPNTCNAAALPGPRSTRSRRRQNDRHRLLIGAFPMTAGSNRGHLLILHDLSFVDERAASARLYATVALLGVIVGTGLLATAAVLGNITRLVAIGPLRRRRCCARRRARPSPRRFPFEFGPEPIAAERDPLGSQGGRRPSGAVDAGNAAPAAGRAIAGDRGDRRIEPRALHSQPPQRLHRAADSCEWPRCRAGAGNAGVRWQVDRPWQRVGRPRDVVDENDHIRVPPSDPAYTLRRIWLTEDEQEGYYYGFANEGLWPLCHIAFVRPTFRLEDWQQYVAINQRFADAVAEEATRADPIVLVHDYHFALVPRMVRERLPHATILTFWHIPWPNAETFGICPWREEIMHGLLEARFSDFILSSTATTSSKQRIDSSRAALTVSTPRSPSAAERR